MDKKQYKRFADAHAPSSPIGKDCFRAFWVGGLICVLGQLLRQVSMELWGLSEEKAGTVASVALILLAALFSGLGLFDRIAKYAGAGTLVPITGFANSVVSPAIDCHAEGLILGVGAKIFTVAGPVLLFGTVAGTLYGCVYWLLGLIF